MFPSIENKINGRAESLDLILKKPEEKKILQDEVLPALYRLCHDKNDIFLKQLDSVIDYLAAGNSIGNVSYMLNNPDDAIKQINTSVSSAVYSAIVIAGSEVKEKLYGFSRDYEEVCNEGVCENCIKALEGD